MQSKTVATPLSGSALVGPALRAIHRRSRRRSPNPGEGLGVSELFTASEADREVILNAIERGQARLAMFLLGQLDEQELVGAAVPA